MNKQPAQQKYEQNPPGLEIQITVRNRYKYPTRQSFPSLSFFPPAYHSTKTSDGFSPSPAYFPTISGRALASNRL